MFLNAPLLAVAACPHDPWGNFMAWLFCDVLGAFGVETKELNSDLLAGYLNSSTASGGVCAGLVEQMANGTCVTHNLWQVTETAGIPLVVVALGARSMRLLTQSNFSVSLGWSLADPVLRAIVAIGMISVSFPIMVYVHEASLLLGSMAYQAITSAGGADVHAGVSFGLSANILVTIIQWLYCVVLFAMVLASLVGFQVCIVLAPLVIPLWVYGSDASLFAWFARTVVGAVVLPLALGVGWAVVVVLTHQFDFNSQNPNLKVNLLRIVLEFVIMSAGVWFMGKFISATAGELFRGHSMLSTVFYAESTLLNSTRMVGAVMPTRWRSGRLGARLGSWAPWGLMKGSQERFMAERSMVSNVLSRMETNSPLRRRMAGWIGEDLLKKHAGIQANAIEGHFKAGNYLMAADLLSDFDPRNIERMVMKTFTRLPINQQRDLAYRAAALPDYGLGTGADPADFKNGRGPEGTGWRALENAFGPGSTAGMQVSSYWDKLRNLNTPKPPPTIPPGPPGGGWRP